MYAISAEAIFSSSLDDDEEVQGFMGDGVTTPPGQQCDTRSRRTVLQKRETEGERIWAMVENVVEKLSVPTRIRLPVERGGTPCL